MVDMAHFAGLVAGKVLTGDYDPMPHTHIVTTTTHKTLRGPRGGLVLCDTDLAEFVDRGCPMVLGPATACHGREGRRARRGVRCFLQDLRASVVDNARVLAESLVAGGVPVVTGGTDNHLVLLDVRPFGLNGRQAEAALRAAGITLNRNVVPNETNGAWYTSGLRLGTPAVTTLGSEGGRDARNVEASSSAVLQGASAGVIHIRAESRQAIARHSSVSTTRSLRGARLQSGRPPPSTPALPRHRALMARARHILTRAAPARSEGFEPPTF